MIYIIICIILLCIFMLLNLYLHKKYAVIDPLRVYNTI